MDLAASTSGWPPIMNASTGNAMLMGAPTRDMKAQPVAKSPVLNVNAAIWEPFCLSQP